MSRRVLVTAGAAGIGRAIAQAFADAGDRVFTCDVDEAALAQSAREIPGLLTARCDVSDRAQVVAMVAEAVERLGGLDILVNNAGIGGPTAPVQAVDPEDWDRVLAVNLTGTFNVTHNAVPHLIRAGAGVIVNISSVAGRFGYPNRSPYSTTKWGLIGFTKSLSIELGPQNIRVNAILPGAVQGPRMQRVLGERARVSGKTVAEIEAAALANQSMKAFVDAADVGAMAVYLASDAAKSISGQALSIDGDMQHG